MSVYHATIPQSLHLFPFRVAHLSTILLSFETRIAGRTTKAKKRRLSLFRASATYAIWPSTFDMYLFYFLATNIHLISLRGHYLPVGRFCLSRYDGDAMQEAAPCSYYTYMAVTGLPPFSKSARYFL